ncbi:MAG: hypothetical protein D6739_07110 [Nitrospirae bacterium]|nr:MAG: hypothetical protein D6739_07110 [Nitrospirota bacterium]
MNDSRIPLILIGFAVATSLVVGLVPGVQPPSWHGAVSHVEVPSTAAADHPATATEASAAPEVAPEVATR